MQALFWLSLSPFWVSWVPARALILRVFFPAVSQAFQVKRYQRQPVQGFLLTLLLCVVLNSYNPRLCIQRTLIVVVGSWESLDPHIPFSSPARLSSGPGSSLGESLSVDRLTLSSPRHPTNPEDSGPEQDATPQVLRNVKCNPFLPSTARSVS